MIWGQAYFAKIKNKIPNPISIQKSSPKEGVISGGMAQFFLEGESIKNRN